MNPGPADGPVATTPHEPPGQDQHAERHLSLARHWGAWVFGLLAFGGVIAVIGRLADVERFGELLAAARPLWLLGGFALQALTYVVAATVWYLALDRAGSHQSLGTLIPLSLAKLFSDQAMPTAGVSGTLVLLRGLLRRGVARPTSSAVMLLSLVTYYSAYLLATLISLAVVGRHHPVSAVLAALVGVFALVAVGLPLFAILFMGPVSKRLRQYSDRFPGLRLLVATDTPMLVQLLRQPRLLIQTTGLHLLVLALDATTFYLMLLAIGVTAAPPDVFASFVLASIAATLAPVPIGLGAFEGTAVAMLRLSGIDLEAALTATLMLRGLTVWIPMLPGLWMARRELRGTHESANMQT